jgi:beta-lactamase regulating signal transducer with metallopeptidase domain
MYKLLFIVLVSCAFFPELPKSALAATHALVDDISKTIQTEHVNSNKASTKAID